MGFQVLNCINAPRHVLMSIMNKNEIDFELVIPTPKGLALEGDMHGLYNAKRAVNQAMSNITEQSKLTSDVVASLVTSFKQLLSEPEMHLFKQMMNNLSRHGFESDSDFKRYNWGLICNAFGQSPASTNELSSQLLFHTKNGSACIIIRELAKRFPRQTVTHRYLQLESNPFCGFVTLKGETVIESGDAPCWDEQTKEQRSYWGAFCRKITDESSKAFPRPGQ